jgi:hypothetical protein
VASTGQSKETAIARGILALLPAAKPLLNETANQLPEARLRVTAIRSFKKSGGRRS